MGINLDNKLSRDDIGRVSDKRNHAEYDDGFEESVTDDLDGFFDDLGDFGAVFGNLTGEDSRKSNSLTDAPTESSGFGGFGKLVGVASGFANFDQPAEVKPIEKDNMDKLMDASIDMLKDIGSILLELVKSIKLRTIDEYGYLSRNLIMAGVGIAGSSLAIGIIGTLTGVKYISFYGLPTQLILCGALLIASGLIGIGASAFILEKLESKEPNDVSNIPDLVSNDNFTDEYESNIDSELDDLMGGGLSDFSMDDLDFNFGDDEEEAKQAYEDEYEPDFGSIGDTSIDGNKLLEGIHENQYISRETLFQTFKSILPLCTPDFCKKSVIDEYSEDFSTIETICLKALANISNTELEDVNSKVELIEEGYFAYEIRLKRINKVKNTAALASEIENYMKSGSADDSVNATVDIEGDFYKIVVTKGVTAIVTIGDIFKIDACCDFFLDKKNKLPIIIGVDELGNVILDDAKAFDTMLIAGKPRSGKSWYLLILLMSLMLFNSPEDVQIIIVDPKESNLFRTLALMPHVCGLHTDEHILDIMDDIINVEGARRRKLLADNKCDDIWALRKKGINLPILYLVIDEYITVRNNLGSDDKELDTKLQVIISQLPSQGIRLIFVPHRATGIVNRTNRTLLSFTACVRLNIEDVKDTLDIKQWSRALTNQGDVAVKTTSNINAMYVKGAALTIDDDMNTEFIRTAAKIFYKMGVDIPDMTGLIVACNRDNEYIRNELEDGAERIQYDANHILDNI